MKMLVETTGPFMLVDPTTNIKINAFRPSVVKMSSFFQARVAMKQVNVVISALVDEATDEDFVKVWQKDKKTAVETFNSRFAVKKEVVAPAPNMDAKAAGGASK